jgi:protein-tyrosine-phosphatase/DNA-binding HxlR family transcriptional regulator
MILRAIVTVRGMTTRASTDAATASLRRRAMRFAALGDPIRLAIVDDLALSDRAPKELADRLGVPGNLLAHHLDVLEAAGLVVRFVSAGDRRRRYVRLTVAALEFARPVGRPSQARVMFLCSHNSARSQLAAALWTARTGVTAESAGTHPADRVHRRAVSAARRAGLDLRGAVPRRVGAVADDVQVITVCDRVHEELDVSPEWWHWSIPDPVDAGTDAAFDAVLHELELRIAAVVDTPSIATGSLS